MVRVPRHHRYYTSVRISFALRPVFLPPLLGEFENCWNAAFNLDLYLAPTGAGIDCDAGDQGAENTGPRCVLRSAPIAPRGRQRIHWTG